MLNFSLIVTYHLPAFIIVSDPDSKQGAPSGCKVGGAATVLSTGGGGGIVKMVWLGLASAGLGAVCPLPLRAPVKEGPASAAKQRTHALNT